MPFVAIMLSSLLVAMVATLVRWHCELRAAARQADADRPARDASRPPSPTSTIRPAGQLGRRAQGIRAPPATVSVWFGLLNRLARYAPAGEPGSGTVRRQRFPDGLLGQPWDASLVTLVAVATGAILYDGLSQTKAFFDLFGLPGLGESTIILSVFLIAIASVALLVGRRIGLTAIGAGLLPVSVGYLIAHYLTYLLGDGQRILIAVSDPFQLGWDLFGTAFHEPGVDWLAPSVLWSIVFVAVVGGHVLGAWAGHLGDRSVGGPTRRVSLDQLPLALVMIMLTTVTLWSLGQAVITDPVDEASTRGLALRAGAGAGP